MALAEENKPLVSGDLFPLACLSCPHTGIHQLPLKTIGDWLICRVLATTVVFHQISKQTELCELGHSRYFLRICPRNTPKQAFICCQSRYQILPQIFLVCVVDLQSLIAQQHRPNCLRPISKYIKILTPNIPGREMLSRVSEKWHAQMEAINERRVGR